MTRPLRLVLFDVDGTLVDSQAHIVEALTAAFADIAAPLPPREQLLSIVGLSLHRAMATLAPALGDADHDRMAQVYKAAYSDLRQRHGAASSPLYPGIRAVLDQIAADPFTLIGAATGKSRRGLNALLDDHDLADIFVTRQTADDHPSKPHPSMIETALRETGVSAQHCVMIGDTTFDMQMAQAAGVPSLGVGWGYHPQEALAGFGPVLQTADQIPQAIDAMFTGPRLSHHE